MSFDGSQAREIERASIRAFLESRSELLGGRVLDFGCGQQPYRDVVEAAGGSYFGYDRKVFPGNVSVVDVGAGALDPRRRPLEKSDGLVSVAVVEEDDAAPEWDAIVCTQVVQYVEDIPDLLGLFRYLLDGGPGRDAGVLLLTYPTSWPEVEPEDLHRFTRAGMERLLGLAGFDVVEHEERARLGWPGFELALGYGVVARP